MEHYGILGLLPPLITIVLALLSKDVILSLFLGIFSGTLILAGGNPIIAIMKLTDGIANSLADGWNIRILLFCALLGALIGLLAKTGAARAFGLWASSKVKTKTGVLLLTWVFGLLIFIDDYFNSLTIGTVMKPVSDEKKVSRAKLAYILDSTAAPVCILAPISSWVVTVMSLVRDSDGFGSLGVSEFSFFIQSIPFNLYAILTLVMVALIAVTKRDFGPMLRSELRAEKGKGLYDEKTYGPVSGNVEEEVGKLASKPMDMLFPIIVLIVLAIVFFPVTTYMSAIDGETITTFGQAVGSMTLGEAFNNTDASVALFYAVVATLFITYVYFAIRKLLNIKTAADGIVDGIKSMVPAIVILAMAWTIGSLIKNAPADDGLGLSTYLSEVVVNGGFPLALLPLIVFALSCLISFSTGTSWGTFAIMIPITMPIAVSLAQNLGMTGAALMNAALISVGGVLAGAIFGDHCSPISDTTILSSIGASCPHLEHVATQIPYAVFIAACAGVGFLFAGLTNNMIFGWAAALVIFIGGMFLLPKVLGANRYSLD
ncbi:MAG TPA: Na+/H+ antiporter NhaC family protein [Thermotogota bacterium]|jgi:Na+/H+ antiporter NhaC|nr:Na+/H+ antiporter NhaC family protein [Thermotogota bacterium]NLH18700.1 Na+/H+ antiporter NhaC family protein [Thermotogaceae bacterium]OQC31283.1 MAG: Na+/H+ antiporter family protein [Thermotogota bacterium ADurb.Bin062]HNW46707.1 Na+/H+ antiporter NhaC family protein [Thermotogota bacterium]HNY83167.1 Na+/H+ antiporter NhaC family protein [Thermotogota bacterium]